MFELGELPQFPLSRGGMLFWHNCWARWDLFVVRLQRSYKLPHRFAILEYLV